MSKKLLTIRESTFAFAAITILTNTFISWKGIDWPRFSTLADPGSILATLGILAYIVLVHYLAIRGLSNKEEYFSLLGLSFFYLMGISRYLPTNVDLSIFITLALYCSLGYRHPNWPQKLIFWIKQ